MKTIRPFLLCAAFLAAAVLGADNYVELQSVGSGNRPATISSAEMGGVHYGVAAATVKSTALEASRVLKGSAVRLCSIAVFNSKASAQFILLIDAASVPGDGPVTLLYPPIPVPAGSLADKAFPIPLTAANGIVVCNSSTGSFTKTIGAADCIFTAQIQ